MPASPCVVSVAEHAGWAHLIGVAAPDHVPAVIERRRVTTIDPGLPTMPYHHESLGMGVAEADALIARVRRSIGRYGDPDFTIESKVMTRTILAAAIFAVAPSLAHAQVQSASAPLLVTATVVSTCIVDVPGSAEASNLATLRVTVTCAKSGGTPRVQRPVAPSRSEVRDAVLIINF